MAAGGKAEANMQTKPYCITLVLYSEKVPSNAGMAICSSIS